MELRLSGTSALLEPKWVHRLGGLQNVSKNKKVPPSPWNHPTMVHKLPTVPLCSGLLIGWAPEMDGYVALYE